MNTKTKLLSNKHILLGVCGVSTAYEAAHLARRLREKGADVKVVLGEESRKFITPLTFEEVTGGQVLEETGLDGEETRLKEAAGNSDMVIIAPASFSFIGHLASNLEGGALHTVVSLSDQPTIIAPSMDRKLYASENVRSELNRLQDRGFYLVEPSQGEVPDETSTGSLLFPPPEEIISRAEEVFREDSLLTEKKVLVTAGPTRRPFTKAREPGAGGLSTLGFELSKQARGMGAEVLLVSGPTEQIAPPGVGLVWARTQKELDELLMKEVSQHDVLLMTASAEDWDGSKQNGIFKEEKTMRLDLDIEETPNILKKMGKLKEEGQILVSIDYRTGDSEVSLDEKIEEDNLDACFHREAEGEPSPFRSTLFTGRLVFRSGQERKFEGQNKARLARNLLKEIGEHFYRPEH
ncbi:MAG: phosphopantothenoylcysteine decarboxylase [Candidatus Acetothermia bacterium]